jgi:hypothetical protein
MTLSLLELLRSVLFEFNSIVPRRLVFASFYLLYKVLMMIILIMTTGQGLLF